MSNVTTADFVGGTDGYTASRTGLGTKVALLLNDDDDTIAYGRGLGGGGGEASRQGVQC